MPLGNSQLSGVAYFDGNPSLVSPTSFDVQKGTLVIDQTNAEVYQKTGPLGTNTGSYVTVGSQMEKVTLAGAYTNATATDIVGLSGFTLEASSTYYVSGFLPVSADVTGGIKVYLNFGTITPASVGIASIATLVGSASHQATTTAAASLVVIDKVSAPAVTAILSVKFEGIITIGTTAATMKVQASQSTANGTSNLALGGTVTVTKVL